MQLQVGRVEKRMCPRCDHALAGEGPERTCPRCGGGLVEIRGEPDPLVGQTIDGRFEIRDRLGKGGMGTVYRAYQRSVDREVAIKLMDPGYARDPTAVRRFEREAQLASRLSQPNTVSVFDSGKAADGRLFIAMELIRGRTLHKVLTTDGTFSIARAARIGVQICDALEAAHGLGIVHRDLKLENVMVLDHPPGRDLVKVLDFGLAKQLGDLDAKGTGAGIVVGTPRYMAPEIAIGGAMSPAADLYALGVMLGELVTGRPLWDGDRLPDLLRHKLAPGPALANVPAPLRALVGELVDPRPEGRPGPAAVRARLAAEEEPVAAPRSRRASVPDADTAFEPRPVRRTNRWGLVGLVLVAIIAIGLVVLGLIAGGARPAAGGSAASGDDRGSAADRGSLAPQPPPDPWAVDSGPPSGSVGTSIHEATTPDAPARARPDATTVIVHVRSRPSGAEVFVHHKLYGRTPVDLELESGADPVEIEMSIDQIAQRTRVTPDRERTVELVFPTVTCRHGIVDPKDPRCVLSFCKTHPDDLRCAAN